MAPIALRLTMIILLSADILGAFIKKGEYNIKTNFYEEFMLNISAIAAFTLTFTLLFVMDIYFPNGFLFYDICLLSLIAGALFFASMKGCPCLHCQINRVKHPTYSTGELWT